MEEKRQIPHVEEYSILKKMDQKYGLYLRTSFQKYSMKRGKKE